MSSHLDRKIILVAEGTCLGADQIANGPGVGVEVAPVGNNSVQGDVSGRWQILGSLSQVNRRGEVWVSHLPAGVDTVQHGVKGVPDGILSRDKDVGGRRPHNEVSTGVNTKTATTDDTVDQVLQGLQIFGLDSSLYGGVVAPCLGGEGVQVTSQASLVLVVDAVWGLGAVDQELVGDVVHGLGHALEWTGHDAATTGTVGKREGWREDDGVVVGEEAVSRHGVLGAVEDWRSTEVVGGGRPVPVWEGSGVTTGLSKILLVDVQEHSVPGQEETVQMNDSSLVDVDDCVVVESINGSWVQGLVELGWLVSQAVDSGGVRLAHLLGHGVEVLSNTDVGIGARLILSLASDEVLIDDREDRVRGVEGCSGSGSGSWSSENGACKAQRRSGERGELDHDGCRGRSAAEEVW